MVVYFEELTYRNHIQYAWPIDTFCDFFCKIFEKNTAKNTTKGNSP